MNGVEGGRSGSKRATGTPQVVQWLKLYSQHRWRGELAGELRSHMLRSAAKKKSRGHSKDSCGNKTVLCFDGGCRYTNSHVTRSHKNCMHTHTHMRTDLKCWLGMNKLCRLYQYQFASLRWSCNYTNWYHWEKMHEKTHGTCATSCKLHLFPNEKIND